MLDPDSFGGLLARHIRRRGWSSSEAARRAALNPSSVIRYCSGDRACPERAAVLALARGLGLTTAERDALMAAAGYLPPSLQKLGADDSTLVAVVRLLTDDALDPAIRADARAIIETVCARFGQLASARRPAKPPARRAS